MNKKRVVSIVASLVILAGIVVAAFPLVDYLRMEYHRKELLAAYEQQFPLEMTVDESVDSFVENMTEPVSSVEAPVSSGMSYPVTLEEDVVEFTTKPGEAEATTPTSSVDKSTDLTMIGTIEIPKIEVNIPIFKYSTQYQMDFGAVHVEGTTPIGSVGNCGIAAHRGRAKWYFFNRLDELVDGDEIIIHHNGKVYEYTVYESLIVLPHQTEVLNRSKTKKVLTLITCDPPGSDQYRLIIHAIQK